MADTEPTTKKSKKTNPWKKILLVALILVAGGVAGYYIGVSAAESDAKKKYDQQTQQLEEALNETKDSVSGTIEDGQNAFTELEQTLESVQAENAELKATIDQLKQQIEDLEDQLEDAQNSETPTDEDQAN